MRLAPRLLAAALLAASLLATASAEPFGGRLDELRTFMQTRRDAIPSRSPLNLLHERAALTKALAAYKAKSKSLEGDVRIFGRVAAAIEDAEVADAGDLLQTALTGLHDDAIPKRDALAARIALLVDPKLVAASDASLATIDAALASSGGADGSFSARARDLRSAIAATAAADARITKGTKPRGTPSRPGIGYFAALLDGAGFAPTFGSGRVLLVGGAPSEVTVTGYSAPASKGGLEIQWGSGTFEGPGEYALDGTGGVLVVMVKDGRTFYSEGGVVTVTTFDALTRTIAGTFDVQLTSTGGETHALTKGTFDVRRYATSEGE